MPNPLLSDRDVEFLLYDVHDVSQLTRLPTYGEHSRETFDLVLSTVRKLAREVLFPSYRAMDAAPPVYVDGRVRVHPDVRGLYSKMSELGMINASRPVEVGGQGLPGTIYAVASAYLMAANTTAFGYIGLTAGAGHLIERFGSPELRERFMKPMYEGRWTGTMALTEPQAGSSLGDVKTRAIPRGDGSYAIDGSKIFISGGDNDFSENIVHLALGRIEGAPAGTKGISLFAIPRLRENGTQLEDNDVSITGTIHKLGAKGIPSVMLSFGERGDCRGWLVGEAGRGLPHMFQMMNGARIMVGLGGTATAYAAYLESLSYAMVRTQGRPASEKNPANPPALIIEHADVRRMLLRQKAIAEGALSLLIAVALREDLANNGDTRAQALVDLLTPIAKTFPAERGFESNALAVQVHGGYGYSSEYLVESWLRDQKLNSLHEGTSGIQALDLLGRKVMAGGGAALKVLDEEVRGSIARAHEDGHPDSHPWAAALAAALDEVAATTLVVGARGMAGDVEGMLRHSADYLELLSVVVIGWQWLEQATAARRGLLMGGMSGEDVSFYEGKFCAAQYWFVTEMPRVALLAALVRSGDDSFAKMKPGWF